MAEKHQRLRARRKKLGLCLHCGGQRDGQTQTCSRCLRKVRNRPTSITRIRRIGAGLCPRCGASCVGDTQTCRACLDKMRALAVELKKEIVEHYGGCCACCGETRLGFLTVDHIANNGASHRRALFGSQRCGHKFYRWIKREGFPKELQIMCWNCNCGRQNNDGVCPHISDT